jgi:hypothetical protein
VERMPTISSLTRLVQSSPNALGTQLFQHQQLKGGAAPTLVLLRESPPLVPGAIPRQPPTTTAARTLVSGAPLD